MLALQDSQIEGELANPRRYPRVHAIRQRAGGRMTRQPFDGQEEVERYELLEKTVREGVS